MRDVLRNPLPLIPTLLLALVAMLSLTPLSQAQSAGESTAQDNVSVITKSFTLPVSKRTRHIRVYTPPSYDNNAEQYPVVYMHDGQNLFDQQTAYAGEWRIDETLNRLSETNNLNVIVVGIDNGGEYRMNELSPWRNATFGAAEGKAYLNFITQVVKPYIDTQYRTLSGAENTAMIGSSMGGLITHYAALAHPDIFGKVGIFSPSYWYSDKVFTYTKNSPIPSTTRFFITVGGNEGESMVPDVQRMTQLMKAKGGEDISLVSGVVKEGEHNEALWASEFEQAMLWLFSN